MEKDREVEVQNLVKGKVEEDKEIVKRLKKMEIVKEYIKSRKDAVNKSNEAEYIKVLDLMTIGTPLLEDYTEFLINKVIGTINKR